MVSFGEFKYPLKEPLPNGCFSRFLNCTNSAKSYNASQMYLDKKLSLQSGPNFKPIFTYIHIYMVFTTEGFLEVAIESWPEWDFNPRPLNSVQTL